VRARKRFGQHFLEPPWRNRLVDVVAPGPLESFLEIGPGRGELTLALAPHVARLVAVEVDRDLAAELAPQVPPHVRVVTADFLDVDLAGLLAGEPLPVRVVGNLPYNLSSPILFRLFAAADHGRRLADATIMLQREVADRLTAEPGTKAWGVLGVQTRVHADAARLLALPPGAFRPPPAVDSAVVRLRFRPPTVALGSAMAFERHVRGLFQQRRKTLLNALAAVDPRDRAWLRDQLDQLRIDPVRRPETLSVEEVAALSRRLQGTEEP